MKKIKTILIAIIITVFFVIPCSIVNAESKKINVYFFHGDGCPHCEEASKFFNELSKDKEYSKYYTLKKYEVWNNQENASLMQQVAKELNEDASGVPYIIIGEKTFNGYAESMDNEIKAAIKKAYNSKDRKDIIKTIKEKDNESAIIPITITLGVAVLIIGGLVVLAKKM